jgi:hypothetical protein
VCQASRSKYARIPDTPDKHHLVSRDHSSFRL